MKTITHNNLGKKYLVEDCKNIRVEAIVKEVRKGVALSLIRGDVEIDGFKINLTSKALHHGGQRLWFVCPICQMTVGVLYRHPISNIVGCRLCLGLDYLSRRFKRVVEESL